MNVGISLRGLKREYNIKLYWVPGNFDIESNEVADELSRESSAHLSVLMERSEWVLGKSSGRIEVAIKSLRPIDKAGTQLLL